MSKRVVGIARTLGYLKRLMAGETLSVIGILEEDPQQTDATVRRAMLLLETHIPDVVRDAGRPANWRFVGRGAYAFCPWCGKKL